MRASDARSRIVRLREKIIRSLLLIGERGSLISETNIFTQLSKNIKTNTHLGGVTGCPQQLVTLLVYQDLALNALEALSPQTPDPVVTKGTERLPVEPLGLEDVAVHLVHLAPPPRPAPVDAPVLAVAELARGGREPWDQGEI